MQRHLQLPKTRYRKSAKKASSGIRRAFVSDGTNRKSTVKWQGLHYSSARVCLAVEEDFAGGDQSAAGKCRIANSICPSGSCRHFSMTGVYRSVETGR